MVWRSKGAMLLQVFDAMQLAGDGMDACDGERFLAAQGRQQSRQLMGQAGLAAAGGTHEQQVMAAGCRKGPSARGQAAVQAGQGLRLKDSV